MESKYHQLISAIISIIHYSITGDYIVSIVAFLVGVFIDVDHQLDYYLNTGKITFSVKELSIPRYPFWLVFHSTEVALLFPIISFFYYPRIFCIALLYSVHIFMDFKNPIKNSNYFIIKRVMNRGFRKE